MPADRQPGIQAGIDLSHPFQIICSLAPAGVFVRPPQVVTQRMFKVHAAVILQVISNAFLRINKECTFAPL